MFRPTREDWCRGKIDSVAHPSLPEHAVLSGFRAASDPPCTNAYLVRAIVGCGKPLRVSTALSMHSAKVLEKLFPRKEQRSAAGRAGSSQAAQRADPIWV